MKIIKTTKCSNRMYMYADASKNKAGELHLLESDDDQKWYRWSGCQVDADGNEGEKYDIEFTYDQYMNGDLHPDLPDGDTIRSAIGMLFSDDPMDIYDEVREFFKTYDESDHEDIF